MHTGSVISLIQEVKILLPGDKTKARVARGHNPHSSFYVALFSSQTGIKVGFPSFHETKSGLLSNYADLCLSCCSGEFVPAVVK